MNTIKHDRVGQYSAHATQAASKTSSVTRNTIDGRVGALDGCNSVSGSDKCMACDILDSGIWQ